MVVVVVVVNKATKNTFSCLNILFSGLKIKKRAYRNDRKVLPSDLKKCPGSLCLPLLLKPLNFSESSFQ